MASDEEYSDFMDLSDDEFKGSPSKSKKKGRDSSPAGYRIRNALKVPRATTYTAQALYDQMHSAQRFMDGLIPRRCLFPFVFLIYECVITNQKLFYTDTGGGRQERKILPQKYRKLFANKQIVCVEYTDVTDSDEREIFQRVQLGMALTPAEKLQVVNTPRSAFIRSLLTHFPTSSSSYSEDGAGPLAHFDWERTRGSDYRSISQMVFCLYTFPAFAPPGKATDLKRATSIKSLALVSTLEKFLSEPAPFTDDFEENVKATLRVVGAMASDQGLIGSGRDKMEIRGVFRNPAKMAPVELVLAGLLVGSHMGKREAEGRRKLAEGIRDMRAEVRETHVDIRMNTRFARTMLDFVRGWKPSTVMASSSSSTVIATSSSSSIGPASQKPDRMAALRAAKMQMQGGGGGLPLPPQTQGSSTNISANASANGWGQDTGWGPENAGWQVDPPWGRG
ncbi:hypothetical protein J132_10365 [Termitomyces sp. J132]|nr:hypothetical protein J132_10365 [Termitomyces sp. J132]